MKVYSTVTKEEAENFLREVHIFDHLEGHTYVQMSGNHPTFLLSLEKLTTFLKGNDIDAILESLVVTGVKSSTNYIVPEKAIEWIDQVIGDHELAVQLQLMMDTVSDYTDRQEEMQKIIDERIQVLKSVIKGH